MDQIDAKEGLRVYEIGFHIAPSVGDENVAHEVSAIKALLEKRNAEIIAEDFPRLRTLAYPLSKKIKGVKKDYKECYFGWIKFEMDAAEIAAFEKEVEKIESIVRFIVIKTIKENTLYGAKFAAKERMTATASRKEEGGEKEIPKEVNVEEVDKAIENLVVE